MTSLKLVEKMFSNDPLTELKKQMLDLAADIETLDLPNKVYMISYNDGTFDSVYSNEYHKTIKGKFDAIHFKESEDSGKQVFQIVLLDSEEPRRLVVSGGVNAFVVIDFINRLCNLKDPNDVDVELYFEENQKGDKKYINGRIRVPSVNEELKPLLYYNYIPKDKDERLKEFLHQVSELMKRKEIF